MNLHFSRQAKWLILLLFAIVGMSARQGVPSFSYTNKMAYWATQVPYTIAFASFGPQNTDLFIAQADGSNPRPLLAHPFQDYNASFSGDGQWIIFTSERKGSADIYRVHPDGSGLEQLTDDPAFDDQAALSPDGKSLAFVSSRTGQADIYILELATKKLRNLTAHPGGDFRPCWSPDGEWLAFSSDRFSTKPKYAIATLHATEIFIIKKNGSELQQVTRLNGFAGSPCWSKDGKQLIIHTASIAEVKNMTNVERPGGTSQIELITLSDTSHRVLSQGPGEKLFPRWLHDGNIAYSSGGNRGGITFLSGKKGGQGHFESPSWSADGKWMVFHRNVEYTWPPMQKVPTTHLQFQLLRTGIFPSFALDGEQLVCNNRTAAILHNSILRMTRNGTNRSIIYSDSAKSSLCPVWSPDGRQIAFCTGGFFQMIKGGSVTDIAVMNNDGTNIKILTDGTQNVAFPSWSPDSKKLVYRASGDSSKGLRILEVETGKVQILTQDSHDNFPSWSGLGDRIVFTSKRDQDYELYSIKPDGSQVRRLTYTAGNDAHCAYSPDGEWIAFSSARGGFNDEAILHTGNGQPYGDIYVMRADGSEVRRLTNNQYEEGTLCWVPSPKTK